MDSIESWSDEELWNRYHNWSIEDVEYSLSELVHELECRELIKPLWCGTIKEAKPH